MSKNQINVGFNAAGNIKPPHNCACINGLKVSTNKTQKNIELTNNRAEYFSDLAEEYKNMAAGYMEQAKYYAETNANVTVEQFKELEDSLENYVLESELPTKVSAFENDAEYVTDSEMEDALGELDVLPPRDNCENMYLKTDGTDVFWSYAAGGLEIGDIGIAPLGIDETKGLRRYLNGSVMEANSNTQAFINKLKTAATLYPSLICSESDWQVIASSSVGGQCGKFVINYETTQTPVACNIAYCRLAGENQKYIAYPSGTTLEAGAEVYQVKAFSEDTALILGAVLEVAAYNNDMLNGETISFVGDSNTYSLSSVNGTPTTYYLQTESDTVESIRLPKIVMPVQGLTDMTKLGALTEAGLPNIEGSFPVPGKTDLSPSGAFYRGSNVTNWGGVTNSSGGLAFDASRSNPIYGASDTVQQEQIQYPYFIQIATGQETQADITNEIELNNPFFFGMYQYFEAEPNNLSWLKSAGQWNSKAVYPDYYNWLLQEKNNPSTLSIKPNVDIAGSLTNNNGVLSGFSESNYALVPDIPSNIESLEIVFKYTTTDDVTTRQTVYGQNIVNKTTPQLTIGNGNGLSQNLLSLDADNWGTGILTLETPVANTTYTAKTTWDNVSKTHKFFLAVNNGDFVEQGSVSQETVYWVEQLKIGLDMNLNPWLGSIDLNGCYININGSRWWSGTSNGVKYSTEDYNDYDYVINTSDETFRLPVKTKGAPLTAETVPVISNGYGLGLVASSGVHYLIDSGNGAGNILSGTEAEAPMLTGSAYSTSSSSSLNNGQVVGVSTNAAYSGLIADFTGINPEGLYLYFYVGDTIQNANLINAGRLAEQINDIKAIPHIIESYRNGQSWYRVWSDGWCEQGGITNFEDTNKEVLFLKPYRDVNYTVTMAIGVQNDTGIWGSEIACWDRTATGFTTRRANVLWHACGYLE